MMLGTGMPVVGESHHLDELHAIIAEALGQLPDAGEVETTARLTPEPDNPYDPQAITVTIRGRLVGHIPRERTRHVHGLIRQMQAHYDAVPESAQSAWFRGPVRVVGVACDAVIGWSRPSVVGVTLTGIDPLAVNPPVAVLDNDSEVPIPPGCTD